MDLFESTISGGEFPTDYESMVVMGKSYAYDDDDLDYLHNSAISFSQLSGVTDMSLERPQTAL